MSSLGPDDSDYPDFYDRPPPPLPVPPGVPPPVVPPGPGPDPALPMQQAQRQQLLLLQQQQLLLQQQQAVQQAVQQAAAMLPLPPLPPLPGYGHDRPGEGGEGGADAADDGGGADANNLSASSVGGGESSGGRGGASSRAFASSTGTTTEMSKSKNRQRCAHPSGCSRQSQGRLKRNMCQRHYRMWQEGRGEDQVAGAGGPGPSGPVAMAVAAGEEQSQRKRRCRVPGCPKQSQGRRCGGMCQKHCNEAVAAGASFGASPTSLGGGNGHRKRKSWAQKKCRVGGCPKQSQGGRCDYMCAAHFKERGGRRPPPRPAAAAAAGSGAGSHDGARRHVRKRMDGGHHALCNVKRCPKQSQGNRSGYMCAAHFRMYGMEGPPPHLLGDSDNDNDGGDDGEGQGDYDGEEEGGGDAYDYERNNGYYHHTSV